MTPPSPEPHRSFPEPFDKLRTGSVEGPHSWARAWLPADDDPDRPLMTLATTGLDGFPAARTVLLSSVSDVGFRFHTDAGSAKSAQLAADPRAALVIAFPERAQQLVVQGRVTRESAAESLTAFGRRTAYLRQLAWINDPEHARLPTAARQAAWAAAVAQTPDGPTAPPTSWVGYEVVPHRYVFWEGGPDAASRRTEFVRDGDGWSVDHLPG